MKTTNNVQFKDEHIRVILIDPKKQKITEEFVLDDEKFLNSCRNLIGTKCSHIESINTFDVLGPNRHLWVDENGIENYGDHCFFLRGITPANRPVAGSAIIMETKIKNGNHKNLMISLDKIKENILFA